MGRLHKSRVEITPVPVIILWIFGGVVGVVSLAALSTVMIRWMGHIARWW